MNNDLISRSALVETIEKSRKAHASVRSRLTVGDMEQMIKGARSVDAEVVRHGRWVMRGGYIRCPSVTPKHYGRTLAELVDSPTSMNRYAQTTAPTAARR